MEKQDTIHLLKECDAGTKMAVTSIDDVLSQTDSKRLCILLSQSKAHHEKLGNEIHEMLMKYGSEEKDPNVIAKGMSWMKTNMKLAMAPSDATIADLMIDGCNMGVKSLYKYLNEYDQADQKAKDLCRRLISIEESLGKELRVYL